MKKVIAFILMALAFAGLAQPQKINYQGVAVGANGKAIKNASVGLRLSVLDSLPNGSTLYTETQSASTDAAGQFSIYLGAGTATLGTFANIPWANGNDKFLKVEMDAQGGSNYQNMGTTQLVSVPFALAAKETGIIRASNGKLFQLIGTPNGPVLKCYPPNATANAGSDQLNLAGNSTNLSANHPDAGETGLWTIISGNGGVINQLNNPNSLFTKGADSIYSLVWSINGECGLSKDTVTISFKGLTMNVPCASITSVNYLGENYPTVQIGTQCWLAKNLNVGSMLNGSGNQTNNGSIEKYCYNDVASNCNVYGGLYQWAEAVQYENGANNSSSMFSPFANRVKGICPTGWHLPNDPEYCTLMKFLDTTINCSLSSITTSAGGKLKSTSSLWNSNVGANNSSGFSALPGGYRFISTNMFSDLGNMGMFWSTLENSGTTATRFTIYAGSTNLARVNWNKSTSLSVRCLLDTFCSVASAGPDQLNLLGTTATLSANVVSASETGSWFILSGNGATLSSPNNPSTLFTKGMDTSYTLVWSVNGACGMSRDTVFLRFPSPQATGCGMSVPYLGENYPTIQIGNQCWFTKNLNVGTMIPGNVEQTTNSTIEKYCYNNDSNLCATYGGLYQWGEAVQYQNGASNLTSPNSPFFGHVAGICPTGWHIPSESEFCSLGAFLDGSVDCSSFGFTGSDVGQKLKSASGLWVANSGTGGSNSSGFSALPSGLRASNFSFNSLGQRAFFGTSSENSSSDVIYFGFDFSQLDMAHSIDYKGNGFSYRCLKN